MICAHFEHLNEAVDGNLIALDHQPAAVELMDDHILERTENNPFFQSHRFFLEGKPKAILIIELRSDSPENLDRSVNRVIDAFRNLGLGYAYPVIKGEDIKTVWNLRKAGLGC